MGTVHFRLGVKGRLLEKMSRLFIASLSVLLLLFNLMDSSECFGPGMKSQFGGRRRSLLQDGQHEEDNEVRDYACDTTSRDYHTRDISCMQCKRLVRLVKRVLVAKK